MKKQILDENISHKLLMESKNIVNDNVAKLMELFPNCVLEQKYPVGGGVKRCLNFEKLKQELSSELLDDSKERYEFTWPDKRKAILNAITPTNKTLRPNREESKDFDTTQNLYIEGDNLEVLKLLQKTYLGKVKMIYIDPPYNTGNDFIYQDNFKQSQDEYNEQSSDYDDDGNRLVSNPSSNGRFHTDWLNMIYPRLKLARDLLTDDGVIFISIDDNEQANLKKVCDEIFGEGNFVNEIVVNMSNASGPKIQHAIMGKRYPKIKEYILLYAKNTQSENFKLNIPKIDKTKWDKEYNLIIPLMTEDIKNKLQGLTLSEANEIVARMKISSLSEYMNDNNIQQDDDEWKMKNSFRIVASKPNTALLNKASTKTFNAQLAYFSNSSGEKKLIKTDFNRETKTARIELLFADEKLQYYLGDHWADIVTTGGIGQEGNVPFQNGKKPLKLLNRIIKTNSANDSLILDFFSGSATTAHAVMKLNAEDGGNRKFIMVQLPEVCAETSEAYKAGFKNICEIGKERIRRAGQKIKDESPLTTQNLDVGFRVLKIVDKD